MARTKQTARKPGGEIPKAPRSPPAAGGKKKAQKAPKSRTEEKKPHRYRPGTVALRDIRRYQKRTDNLIPKTAFRRLVREVIVTDAETSGFVPGVVPDAGWRIQSAAADAIQTLSESFLQRLFTKSYVLTEARGTKANPRVTCQPRDIETAYKIGVPISENVREPVANAMLELLR
jgi:histone H3